MEVVKTTDFNSVCKDIFEANKAKGFWDKPRENIYEKIRTRTRIS